ncbi:MAG TPA: tyrosine-type recombinase/integrase [Nitrososphaeraceae archaeon]
MSSVGVQAQNSNDVELYSNFINSLRSKATKEGYDYMLNKFMQFHRIPEGNYSALMVSTREAKEQLIKSYVLYLVGKKNASTSYIKMTMSTLKNFYEMNDVEDINWRKLKRFMGEETPTNDTKCYTHEQILTLISNAKSSKLKCAVLLMASAGLRIGALESIKVGHLERRDNLYKVSVYKGLKGKGSYFTFCSPETATQIDSMLDQRRRAGEKIDDNSPLLRRDYDSSFLEQARNNVLPWRSAAVHRGVYDLLVATGLTTVDHTAYRRKDVKMSHGLRSFFVKQLVNANIHDIIIKKLTGHAPGRDMTQLYSKQTEEELLSNYLLAVDNLTINPENRLRRKVQKLEVERTEIQSLALELEKIKKATGLT